MESRRPAGVWKAGLAPGLHASAAAAPAADEKNVSACREDSPDYGKFKGDSGREIPNSDLQLNVPKPSG